MALDTHVNDCYRYGMLKLTPVILAIFACTTYSDGVPDSAYRPDASVTPDAMVVDSPVVSSPQVNGGCMGNLPVSRSLTLSPSDPIPSALLNEIQDAVIGAKHPTAAIVVPASSFCLVSGTATLADGVWTMTSNTPVLEAGIGIPGGDTVVAILGFYIRHSSVTGSTYRLRLRKRIVDTGLPGTASDIVDTTENNGVNFPNLDHWLVNSAPLPYTVSDPQVAPFHIEQNWLEVSANQGGATFDAKLYAVAVFTTRL